MMMMMWWCDGGALVWECWPTAQSQCSHVEVLYRSIGLYFGSITVWSVTLLHQRFGSIAVLHQRFGWTVLQYCISGSDFGVAVSADQREPMLPWRRSHITLHCANVPCLAQMYLVLYKCTLSCTFVTSLVQMYLVLCKCNLSCARVPCANVTILFLDLMLSHHNTLYILPSLAHFVELPCIIGSEGLPWRLCRIPAGIPASVTPSRALCPLQS